jgi:formiminotetrahydrofolate cyclodeaminase
VSEVSRPAEEGLEGWLERLAAPTGSPGGGSASAVAVALAAALVEMGAGLGAKRKALNDDQREEARAVAARAAQVRREALRLAEEDAAAYTGLVEAHRALRSASENDKAGLEADLRRAAAEAADAPLRTGDLALGLADLAESAAASAPQGARTDLAVALLLVGAALQGALHNVNANLPELIGAERAARVERAHELFQASRDLEDRREHLLRGGPG